MYTCKQYVLTIPVNSIDTIPDRPRPSASMYLKKKIFSYWFTSWMKVEKIVWKLWTKDPRRHLTRNMGKGQIDSSPSSEGWMEP